MVNRQKNQKTKLGMIFALAAFASVSLFSYDMGEEDTRGIRTEALRISSRKDSPAYTAFVFSDLKFSNETVLDLSSPSKSIALTSGKTFKMDLLSDPAAVVPLAQDNRGTAPELLKGMVVSSRQILPVIRNEVAAAPAKYWVKDLKTTLPDDQSRRVAMIEDWLKGQSWASTAPTKAEIWQQKIKEVAPTDTGRTLIPTKEGGQIYVGLPGAEARDASENQNLLNKRIASLASSSVQTWKPATLDADPNLRPLTLAGSLEMKDGLAFLGSDTTLVVTRKIGDREIESGTVWISEGKFEIFVKEAKGYLVAELRDRKGQTLGRGSMDLFKLPPTAPHKTRLDGINLSLQPVTKGSQVATLSAHSFGGRDIPSNQTEILSAAHDFKLKKADNQHLTEDYIVGSTTLLEAVTPKSLTTLEVSQLSSNSEMYVFDEKYIQALVELVAPTEVDMISEKGFIMGRVTDQGKAVAGSQVEIAGDFPVSPIYFSEQFIPDRNLKATSSNGMFAAVLVEPSLYSVRASTDGVYLPAKVLPAVKGQVTQALFERKDVASLAVNVMPFPETTSETKRVRVSILGSEEDHDFEIGSHIMQYHEGRGVFVLEASAGDFDPLIRMELPHGSTSANIPVISRHWLDAIATKRRLNIDPEAGKILGFGPDENYEVVIDKGQGSEQIVYLDEEGKPLYEGLGRAGSSFVVYNLKPGMHTVSILTKNGSKIFSRVIVAEFDVVNVVN